MKFMPNQRWKLFWHRRVPPLDFSGNSNVSQKNWKTQSRTKWPPVTGGVVNLYKNQGNLHIHDSGKKEIQIKREKIYTNSDGCRDIHFGK